MEQVIDKSFPVVTSRDDKTRQVVYLNEHDGGGYGAVEMYNDKTGAWVEIHGHTLSEVEIEMQLESIAGAK
jgi:hypothetical protein